MIMRYGNDACVTEMRNEPRTLTLWLINHSTTPKSLHFISITPMQVQQIFERALHHKAYCDISQLKDLQFQPNHLVPFSHDITLSVHRVIKVITFSVF